MTPVISVVVPVYNRDHCIRDALETVLAQEEVSVECIVVDDGSTDETVPIVGAIAESDPRVRLVEIEHGGPSVARNAGIAVAQGELLALHDSDNLMPAGRLAQQARRLAELDADGVFGRYEVQAVEGVDPPAWVRDMPERYAGWSFISLLVRREPVVAIGGFDEALRLGEDIDLIVRLREHGCTVSAVDDVVVVKRWFGDNLTYEIEDVRSPFNSVIRRHMGRVRRS